MLERSNKIKIVLIQLPHPSYLDRNVPLAAGYLKASAHRAKLLEDVEIEILDPILSDYGGCQILIDTIISKEPDVLGFSLYLWNLERTLYIIEKIKVKLPYLKVIVGGPEVTRNSTYILSNPDIDIAVFGEGEITFVEIVKHFLYGKPKIDEIAGISYRKDDNININIPRKRIMEMDLIPSPYLLGFIDPTKYREMTLFTMRGCMLGCTYCSWTARGKLTAFAIERLRKELILAKKIGKEMIVSIMDSAFNASPVFVEFCKMAQEINKDKTLEFNCFIQADLIDEGIAKLLKESNFRNVEVGLQSANPEILANINRSMDLLKFLRGVRFLEKEGISVKVDIIVGLPGDSFTTFEETIKFISDNKLDPILFNLSLGHGAKMSREIKKFGAKVQPYPPYYVLETSTFSRHELEITFARHKENSADFDKIFNLHYPALLLSPYFSYYHNNSNNVLDLQSLNYPIRNIVLKIDASPKVSNKVEKLAAIISKKVGSNLSILCVGGSENLLNSLWQIRTLLIKIFLENPHITCNIFLEIGDSNISQALLEEVLSFIQKPKSFLDHRDELVPKNLPYVRRKSFNIFVLSPFNNDWKSLHVEESKKITTANITDQKAIHHQVKELSQASGCGFLIDFQAGSNVGFIKESMSLLSNLERDIFFRDWVLQRLWEQDFLRITPEMQPQHYELIIDQDMNFFGKLFNENELLWDAITRWKMLKPEYFGSDVEKIIIEKVISRFSAEDKDKSSIGV